MQDVGAKTSLARVMVFESSPERAALITDRLLDHGIDAVFVDRADQIIRSLHERPCHVVILNDCLSSSEELLNICSELRRDFAGQPEIIFSSDNPDITVQDCHAVGCAHLLRRALDFNEICDIIERVAEVAGKRLYDGKQLRHSNRFGNVSGPVSTAARSSQELSLKISEVARGGFYYEFDETSSFKPSEGMLLNFELKLTMFPDYSFRGKGYVSWTKRLPNGRMGIGVEFALIPMESENIIKAFSDLFKIREFVPTPRVPELRAA